MKHSFPTYRNGQVLALIGATLLHGGIAAWAMAPEPPEVLPEQQVIQITMVAPTIIQQQEVIQPVEEVKETSDVPPKDTGMVKVQPKQQPVKKAEKIEKPIEQQQVVQMRTQLTSGLQSSEAVEKNAAITEPVAAAYLNNPSPEYPARARSRKQQGTVLLQVRVTEEGHPSAVRVSRSSGHQLLDTAALEAVQRWKFVPARRGSQLVEASVVVPVEFRIN